MRNHARNVLVSCMARALCRILSGSIKKTVLFSFLVLLLICIANCAGNHAPDTPLVPVGPANGAIGDYTFSTLSTDPDGDSVAIMFDWGDESQSEWSNYVASGDTITMMHSYSDSGTYQIIARAKDIEGAESDWSGAHVLEISGRVLWTKQYGTDGDDFGYAVQQLSNGRYIVAGYTNSNGDDDIYLLKIEADGILVWARTYGGADDDRGYSAQVTSDGSYIVAGYTSSFGVESVDIYLLKIASNGSLAWQKTYGGAYVEHGYSVQQTSDGGYIVTGYTSSFGAGHADVYLVKTDANGDTLWTRTYGGASNDIGYSVQQTSDGGYIVAGYTYGAGGADVYLIKTDAYGDTLWTGTYGGASWDRGSSVVQTDDDGYAIAAGNGDVYLVKTDANGVLIWEMTYGGVDADYGRAIQQTSDGGYIVAGYTLSFGSSNDVYLVKTEADGSIVWEKAYGSWQNDYGYAVKQISDGGYIVTGAAATSTKGYEVMLSKIAP